VAPEVVHNAKKGYSAKVDIWSLGKILSTTSLSCPDLFPGCVVLEMFAGRRPWDAEFAIAAMFKARASLATTSLQRLTLAQLGAERLAPPVPDDVTLSPNAASFLSRCFTMCVLGCADDEADADPQRPRPAADGVRAAARPAHVDAT
jgi:mitogen-activated protein kinase kinase kinase